MIGASESLVPVTVVADEAAMGRSAAALIWNALGPAAAAGRPYVLGCPAGRSPRSTYQALASLATATGADLSRLHIVMMDDYVEQGPDGWRLCPEDAHYSCRGFGEREIRQALNADLPAERQVPRAHLHSPDPGDPQAYDRLIAELGGVDLFLMASGASDGHVAFNPPGVPLDRRTWLVELAETTRQDNLGTFPKFADLAAVPRWGVTISPGSIMRLSRAAVLLLPGAGKARALKRIAGGYDPDWPASVIHKCRSATILADRAAQLATERL